MARSLAHLSLRPIGATCRQLISKLPRRAVWLICGSAGVSIFFGAFLLGRYLLNDRVSPGIPLFEKTSPLIVDSKHLDFGDVCEEAGLVWILPIRNTSNEEIEIKSFDASCGCLKIEPPSLAVPANSMTKIQLALDLTSAHKQPTLAGQNFEVYVRPRITRGSRSQPSWVLHGKVKRPFVIDPPILDFQECLIQGQPFLPRSTTITCAQIFPEPKVTCDSALLTVKLTPEVKNPAQFHLDVQPSATMPSGDFRHLIRLKTTGPDGTTLSATVPVVGRILQDVCARPELVAFGAVPIGSSLKETVVLHSRSGQEFTVKNVKTEGGVDLDVGMGRKAQTGHQTVLLSIPRTRLGGHTYRAIFKIKSENGLFSLVLQITYHGIVAENASSNPRKENHP